MSSRTWRDFRDMVERRHDRSSKTCHWSDEDVGGPGPCACPSPTQGGAPCGHHGLRCTDTRAVLGLVTPAQQDYDAHGGFLDKLDDAMRTLGDSLAQGLEYIDTTSKHGEALSWNPQPMSVAEAMATTGFQTWADGALRSAVVEEAVQKILDLQLTHMPATFVPDPAALNCACFQHKTAALSRDGMVTTRFATLASEKSVTLAEQWAKTTIDASVLVDALRTILDALMVVRSVLTSISKDVIQFLFNRLNEYLRGKRVVDAVIVAANAGDGPDRFRLALAVFQVGQLKAAAAASTIYYEQRRLSATCVSPAGGGAATPPAPTGSGSIPDAPPGDKPPPHPGGAGSTSPDAPREPTERPGRGGGSGGKPPP